KSRQNITTFLWTTPILLLCGLIVYFDSSLNACYGLVHGLGYLFLLLILFVLVIIFLASQIYKIIKNSENRKSRILASLLVVITTAITIQGEIIWKELRLGNRVLSASIYPDQLDIGRLELLDEEKYYAV